MPHLTAEPVFSVLSWALLASQRLLWKLASLCWQWWPVTVPTSYEPRETWDCPCEAPSVCGRVLPFLLKVIYNQRVQWWILVSCTWTAQSGSLVRLDSLGRNNVFDLGPRDHRGLGPDRASVGMALSMVLPLKPSIQEQLIPSWVSYFLLKNEQLPWAVPLGTPSGFKTQCTCNCE